MNKIVDIITQMGIDSATAFLSSPMYTDGFLPFFTSANGDEPAIAVAGYGSRGIQYATLCAANMQTCSGMSHIEILPRLDAIGDIDRHKKGIEGRKLALFVAYPPYAGDLQAAEPRISKTVERDRFRLVVVDPGWILTCGVNDAGDSTWEVIYKTVKRGYVDSP